MVTLYSTGCPKCKILERKLDAVGIEYQVNSSTEEMIAKGFTQAPMLEVDGKVMDFSTANEWVNNYEDGDAE